MRYGVLLRVDAGDLGVGWGDCAPLPGMSDESLEDAQTQLLGLADWIGACRIERDLAEVDHPLHEKVEAMELAPSVRFALDTALLSIAAQTEGVSLGELLVADPSPLVPVNALVTGSEIDTIVAGAQAAVARGHRTIKVKVGRGAIIEDVKTIRALRRSLGPEIAIRCDANQAWTIDEAIDFSEGIFGLGVQYVEEPLANPADLGSLWMRSQMPVALDESLAYLEPADLEAKAYATAVVLKPTLLGGIVRTLQFAEVARRSMIPVTISSLLESGIGFRACAVLASVTGAIPAGLEPYFRLATDVVTPRPQLLEGVINVEALLAEGFTVVDNLESARTLFK